MEIDEVKGGGAAARVMPDYGNINKFLAARSYGAMLAIVERDERAKSPRSVGDLMLIEILKRLHIMRGIAARAARLPLSDEERRLCQREIDALKDEIEDCARGIPPAAAPEDIMPALDSSIARVSGMVDGFAKRSGEPKPRSEPAPARGAPSDDAPEEEKIARWMESLMGGWDEEPEDE